MRIRKQTTTATTTIAIASVLTLYVLLECSFHFDTINFGWFILYIEGLHVIILSKQKCISFHLGLHCLPKYSFWSMVKVRQQPKRIEPVAYQILRSIPNWTKNENNKYWGPDQRTIISSKQRENCPIISTYIDTITYLLHPFSIVLQTINQSKSRNAHLI